ncbi:NAD-dependent epimerase/dehydratase domain-containing protein [Flavobacterium branchiophilum]|uniref:NAD-dependent epimerase/dehydratase domain-containing protein n=2 Tax=Flavobacterium branchiophilum TaxID=55197 RepID=A0A2H3KBW9_9FLAO|nr:NAD-dependent epimerase/dehydratase family protein [Flavobacterium branchiophilum]PDS24645.1 hypothetical protein B0A77_07670 [Flavobacterium branchiophilum]CCB68862.1 Probable nucleoside-diphosphate-sugar epimerase [Flavobacterium branchiophilum FL-15]
MEINIAIIGASGFLGKSFVDYFNNKNIPVTAFSRTVQNKNWKEFDVLNYKDLSVFESFTHVFYCAAGGVQRNNIGNNELRINSLFPIELSNYLNNINTSIKFISFGSYFEIGDNSLDKEWTEKEIIYTDNIISSEYIESKKILTYYSYIAKKSYHFILPTIYGEKENSKRLIPYIINSLKKNEKITISSGEQIRQYVYVEDVLKIIWENIVLLNCGVYNISGEVVNINQIVKYIFSLFDSDIEISIENNFRDLSMMNLKLKQSNLIKEMNLSKSSLLDNLKKYL